MKKIVYIVFFLFTVCSGYSQTNADTILFTPQYQPDVNYNLTTRSGSIYTGVVINETAEFVTLKNKITQETVELRKTEITSIRRAGSRDLTAEIMGTNLHARNYMFLSSAFLFEEGKAKANSHWLILENISYAFTENWAITLNTLAFYPVTLAVNCAFQLSEDNYVGGSVFAIGDVTSGGNNPPVFGYGVHGKFTHGSSNKNISLSGGIVGLNADLFYSSRNNTFVNTAFISAAYCNRFSKNVALNLEGWYLPELASGLGGFGFKFIGNKITCWTVGCYAFINNSDNSLNLNLRALPVPYFGVSRTFN